MTLPINPIAIAMGKNKSIAIYLSHSFSKQLQQPSSSSSQIDDIYAPARAIGGNRTRITGKNMRIPRLMRKYVNLL
jgi:hypothetical protein